MKKPQEDQELTMEEILIFAIGLAFTIRFAVFLIGNR